MALESSLYSAPAQLSGTLAGVPCPNWFNLQINEEGAVIA